MKLVLFGSSITSAHANGATTFFRGICRALHRLGWEICFLEEAPPQRRCNTKIRYWTRGITVRFYQANESISSLISALPSPEVIIKFSACGSRDQEIEEELLARRSPQQRVVLADGDAPALLPSILQDPNNHYWWRIIPGFDAVLLLSGGKKAIQHYRILGARQIYHLASGVDPQSFTPRSPESSLAGDLLFVGNRLSDRETRVQELFFAIADQSATSRFLLAGAGWEDYPLPANVSYLGFVSPTRLPFFYSSACFVLNLTRTSMMRYGYSPSSRLFEAAACGACILSDAWEGIEHFFCPGEEIQLVHTTDDVLAALQQITEEERKKMGAAARQRVLQQHTFNHRAQTLTHILYTIAQWPSLRILDLHSGSLDFLDRI